MANVKLMFQNAWIKFKKWIIALLVSIGILSGGLLMAETKNFQWTNPTQNTDGTAFDAATEQAEVRIYCDVDPGDFTPQTPSQSSSHTPTLVSPGAATGATKDFLPGSYSCFATAFSVYDTESGPSGVVEFTVLAGTPNPPTLSVD